MRWQKGIGPLLTSHVFNFGTADGLRKVARPAAIAIQRPRVFAMVNSGSRHLVGVAEVDPDHLAALPSAPPVVIERFSADDQPVGQTAPGQQIRLSPGHLRLQFDYAGLSFAAPQKLRYQYMLQGFDKSWTDSGTRRTAYYTNIPPGQYHFLVRTVVPRCRLF